jgi:signal transduction histidine kinase
LNGGSIAVTSERLRGTTVEITLPIADASSEPPRQASDR